MRRSRPGSVMPMSARKICFSSSERSAISASSLALMATTGRAFLRGVGLHALEQRVALEAVLAHVGDVERGLRGEERERLQERELIGRQAHRANRMQPVERLLDPLEDGDELDRFLFPRAHVLRIAQQRLLDRLHVGERELGVDHLDVGDRIHAVVDVDDVAVLEAAHHVGDGVGLADVGEELVAEALALRGARDEARDVDELPRSPESPSGACRSRRASAGADRAPRPRRRWARWCRRDSSPRRCPPW